MVKDRTRDGFLLSMFCQQIHDDKLGFGR